MQTLRLNSRGPEVAAVQSVLNRIGLNAGETDGIFGNRTERAVIRFQRSVGIAADGIVGARTWKALEPRILGYDTYIVRSGDTMYEIARKYGTSLADLRGANPNVDPEHLRVGQSLTVPIGDSIVFTDIPYSYRILEWNLQGLCKRYPFVRRGVVGHSAAGKEIPYLMIGEGSVRVGYNAAHHANEWITTPVLMKFAEQFCRAYLRGALLAGEDAGAMYRSATTVLIPMVNPDGVDLVTGGYPPESKEYKLAQAMNRGGLPFPSGWKANLFGTDLNLNYPAGWEEAKRIKFAQGYTQPGPRDYVGSSPLSAPESRAMAEFTARQSFRLTLSYHTQGEIIYWKYLNYDPPRSREIAERFAEVSGYTPEETPYASGFAGYKDWFIREYNLPGYTIECGKGSNPLPISQFAKIYRDNLGILLEGIRAAIGESTENTADSSL